MDQMLWKIADEGVDQIAEELGQLLDSPSMAEVKRLLRELEVQLGGELGVSLTCNVELFDRETEGRQEHTLRLLNTGLSTNGKGDVYRTWGDSTPQRYVVNGGIQVVPHDQCPECWGEWDFKWTHPSCEHCGATLGKNCQVLLDTDVCPHCEKGKVSSDDPCCDQCGYEVDPSFVIWG